MNWNNFLKPFLIALLSSSSLVLAQGVYVASPVLKSSPDLPAHQEAAKLIKLGSQTHGKNSDLFDGLGQDQLARFKGSRELIHEMVVAKDGGVAGGGGNENEGDFASLARILYRHLIKNKAKSSEILGFDVTEFSEAIEKVEPHCAADPNFLMLMRELKKTAMFTTHPYRIQIDCENYEKSKTKGDLGPITIFHEYMRSIGRDTSAYETSSKLMLVFYDIAAVKGGLAMLLIDPTTPKAHTCETQSQVETLTKIEKCIPPGNGNGALSSANFDDAISLFRTRLFVRCLSRTYEISKSDHNAQIYWSTIQMGTADYFKFDLTSERNQNKRCALASTLNTVIRIGAPQ